MVKDNQREKDDIRRVLIRLIWSCAAELKLVLTALLLLCSLATLLQLLPSPSSLRSCVSNTASSVSSVVTSPPPAPSLQRPLQQQLSDQILRNGILKRSFNAYGTAAYNFILMSAYRGGATSFAVTGLASKPLHVFSRPSYTCEYVTPTGNFTTLGHKILPDWGYGRVYTTVVINCTFPTADLPVSNPSFGGRLLIHASTKGGFDLAVDRTDTIQALVEQPNSWNYSYFLSPPKYDYLYCGSPLYGDLSPQRVREWVAYHVWLFGKRSHFVIHDAGGVHPEVMDVLKPWMELGFVTLQDVREQERFDAYYHNQFLVVNDCLYRYRFDAKWMFFFDLDEFISVRQKGSIKSVMDSLDEFTHITIEQVPISNQLCLTDDAGITSRKWGFEKLVYKNVMKVPRRDRKYAIQPRNVFATGVHLSLHFQGKSTLRTEKLMKYFHYHGTIAQRGEPCRLLVNKTSTMLQDYPYMLDKTMRSIAPLVKRFELKTIGASLHTTRQ